MKKTIMAGIVFGMVLASLGGCFVPYYEDDRGYRGHDRDRDGQHDRDKENRHDRGDRDDRYEPNR